MAQTEGIFVSVGTVFSAETQVFPILLIVLVILSFDTTMFNSCNQKSRRNLEAIRGLAEEMGRGSDGMASGVGCVCMFVSECQLC